MNHSTSRHTHIFILLGLMALTGCSLGEVPGVSDFLATATPQPITPTATTVRQRPAPSPTATSESVSASIILTVWAPEHLAPGTETVSQRILAEQISAFSQRHPKINIEYQLKKPYGKGGVLDFLLVTSEVVPENLPDVVALDIAELSQAARASTLQPLGDSLRTEAADLFPFAQQAGRHDGETVALPFQVDVEHLAVNETAVETPPLTWTDVLTQGIRYAFPAGGRSDQINDAFLIQYYALGGRLMDTSGNPTLDEAKITDVLQFYQEGWDGGSIPEDVLAFSTTADSWTAVTSGTATVGHVNSQQFLREQGEVEAIGFGTVPTRDGGSLTLARGWAYAVVARDPRRQEAATELLQWLMQPSNLADWTRNSHSLPTRRSALTREEDAYLSFIADQLETARASPPSPIFDIVAEPLQTAVEDVLSGNATPEEAAAAAVEAIR